MNGTEPSTEEEERRFGEEYDGGKLELDKQGQTEVLPTKADRQGEIPPQEEIENERRGPENRQMVDITRDKPVRVTVRVAVPVHEHPKFNFVGKLLGPKGNSLKRLQEDSMTKMAILGRGSMKDKHKEEELRTSGDPKFCHLHDDLHVEITAFAPPAEAHARIAYALADVRRFLVPDYNDDIRQEQMWEMEILKERPDNLPMKHGIGAHFVGAPVQVAPTPSDTPSPSHSARSQSPSGMLGPAAPLLLASGSPTQPGLTVHSSVSSVIPASGLINGRKRPLHSVSSRHSLSPTKRVVMSILSRARAIQTKVTPGYQISG